MCTVSDLCGVVRSCQSCLSVSIVSTAGSPDCEKLGIPDQSATGQLSFLTGGRYSNSLHEKYLNSFPPSLQFYIYRVYGIGILRNRLIKLGEHTMEDK